MFDKKKINILRIFLNIKNLEKIQLEVNKSKSDNKIDIDIESINFFRKEVFEKKNNDLYNKIRENIIKKIINKDIPEEYYLYSLKWYNFKNSLFDFLNKIIKIENPKNLKNEEEKYKSINCKIKGGRKYNYDFDIVYCFENNIEIIKKVEFKFGSLNVEDCPQFISLSSNFNTIHTKYASYFYDNHLKYVSNLYDNQIEITKNEYLKHVHQASYKKHKWFDYLYEKENLNKLIVDNKDLEKKKQIVDKSINDYLELIRGDINLEEITEKFITTQDNKIYMCYDTQLETFNYDFIHNNELIITNIKELKKNKDGLCNTIICNTKSTTEIHMLLRWKNHSGILNPAWQISIKRK